MTRWIAVAVALAFVSKAARADDCTRSRGAPTSEALMALAGCHQAKDHLEEAADAYRVFLLRNPDHPSAGFARSQLALIEKKLREHPPEKSSSVPPAAGPPATGALPKPGEIVQPSASESPRSRRLAWIAGGATVAAAVAGGTFAVMAASTSGDLHSHPHARVEVDALEQRFNAQSRASKVLLGSAVALGAVTGLLLVVHF